MSVSKAQNEARIREELLLLNKKYVNLGLTLENQKTARITSNQLNSKWSQIQHIYTILLIVLVASVINCESLWNFLLGIRCIVPNNYFVWEATRPISNCHFCVNVTKPVLLRNASKEDFAPYAYSSKPIVIEKAFLHWPALELFDFHFFKNLYIKYDDAVESVDEECQFLHFKSDFASLQDVFDMPAERVCNEPGFKSWYVGWGNCHSQLLKEMRQYYEKPHFLPVDCEIPAKDYVFMGYDAGATMHLDFISRLMWQAQLKGSKTWKLLPSNECEHICSSVTFKVEPGDAVLVDTRVWYHATIITPGEFSLSIQSEYG